MQVAYRLFEIVELANQNETKLYNIEGNIWEVFK